MPWRTMLRPYQQDALNAIVEEYDKGTRRQLLVMPTGSGKTFVFARIKEAMGSRLPGQTLILAGREELIDQSIATVRAAQPLATVEKEMAEHSASPTADVIVAGVATLGRKNTSRLEKFNWANFNTVIVDEAHHSTADSYQRILKVSGVLDSNTEKLLVGVTATPNRSDDVSLVDTYEKISYVYSIRQAIKDGWLASPRGYRATTETSLNDVKISHGDFVQSELSQRVNNVQRNRMIVRLWESYGENRRTLIFAVDITHARDLATQFSEMGTPAKAVWGDDPERSTKLEDHKNGKYQVLVNVGIALEGYDDPRISCVVVARPTTSSLVFQQAVGRGLRIAPGKKDCIVLDVVDASIGHSLMTLPTLMGLQNILDLKGRDLIEVVEEIEALQEQHLGIDWTTLKDVDELKTLVQQIDMFEIRFPKETEENSDFIWMKAINGGYRINIPKDGPEKSGFMRIYPNVLDQWEIEGQIKEINLKATRPTMEEAFKASDEQIRKRLGKMRLSYILREATWHGKKVTAGQRKMLIRLFPHKILPFDQMTAGMASKMIAERLGRKTR